MRWQLLGILLVGLLVAADEKDEAVKKELAKLEGDWVAVSGEREGKPFPEDEMKLLKRSVKGDTFEVIRDGATVNKGTFKIDTTKKPKTIVIARSGGQGQTMHGIYEIDGDKYKICYGPADRPLPTEFATKPESGHAMMVWKKTKK